MSDSQLPPFPDGLKEIPELARARGVGAMEITWEEWLPHLFASSSLPGFVICLHCASLVPDGEQNRHYRSLHGFGGF